MRGLEGSFISSIPESLPRIKKLNFEETFNIQDADLQQLLTIKKVAFVSCPPFMQNSILGSAHYGQGRGDTSLVSGTG